MAFLAKWTVWLPALIAFSALACQCFLLSKTRMASALDVSKGAALLSLQTFVPRRTVLYRFRGSFVVEQKGDPLGSGVLTLAEFADFFSLFPDMSFRASRLAKRWYLDCTSSLPHH